MRSLTSIKFSVKEGQKDEFRTNITNIKIKITVTWERKSTHILFYQSVAIYLSCFEYDRIHKTNLKFTCFFSSTITYSLLSSRSYIKLTRRLVKHSGTVISLYCYNLRQRFYELARLVFISASRLPSSKLWSK